MSTVKQENAAFDPRTVRMDTSVTSQLAGFIAGLRWEDLPDEVKERAALLATDTLASIVAGQELESTHAIARGLEAAGTLYGTHQVPGRGEGVSGHAAALLAGAAAHGFDFDDTHAQAQIHPGAPIVSAALAAAQTAGADAKALITGIVAGYEAMTRISYGLNPDLHARKGFHLTATTGVFGAAAAAAVVQGHGQEVLEHAWGTCLSMTAGSGQFLVNGAWTKRFHVGQAAANGFLAVQLAAAGVTGAADALDGRDGFYNLYSPEPVPEEALLGLGTTWEILGTAVKPYPCCRAIHAPLDALLALRQEHCFKPEDIESIEVGVPERCHAITCDPVEAKRNPRNIVDCQFSMHLCLAQAVVRGRASFAEYPEALADPVVAGLMRKINAVVDAEADAIYPRTFPGRVTVRLRSGQLLERYIEVPLGEPSRMLGREQLKEKFVGLAGPVISLQRAESLFDVGITLSDPGADLSSLFRLGKPVAKSAPDVGSVDDGGQ